MQKESSLKAVHTRYVPDGSHASLAVPTGKITIDPVKLLVFPASRIQLTRLEWDFREEVWDGADEWAEEALIPRVVWKTSTTRRQATPMSVMNLAKALQIHPAIIAGRIRFERNNYRLLSRLVGHGKVRELFPEHHQSS